MTTPPSPTPQITTVIALIERIEQREEEAIRSFAAAIQASRTRDSCLMDFLLPIFLILNKAREIHPEFDESVEQFFAQGGSGTSLIERLSTLPLSQPQQTHWKNRIRDIEDLRTGTVYPKPLH